VDVTHRKSRLEGGGFAKPRPPLFPGVNGRHRQRAYRDVLADLLPPLHGFLPRARIGYFEAGSVLQERVASRVAVGWTRQE